MKFLILAFLVSLAVAQTRLEWSKIKPNHVTVAPRIRVTKPKIVGGEDAPRHGYPHQVALMTNYFSFCGGSLITTKCILTAAHCVDKAKFVDVIVGAHEVNKEEPTQQTIRSYDFVIHEDWDPTKVANDVALIHLSTAIHLDHTAALIALNKDSSSLEGVQAIVSGWGQVSDVSSGVSPVLRYVKEEIISNELCKLFYGSKVRATNICMNGENGKGSCQGDSGGPVIIKRDGGVVQVGTVSFGSTLGCESGYPSVFTRVSKFTDWIEKHLPQE